jgi:hypothetical protein
LSANTSRTTHNVLSLQLWNKALKIFQLRAEIESSPELAHSSAKVFEHKLVDARESGDVETILEVKVEQVVAFTLHAENSVRSEPDIAIHSWGVVDAEEGEFRVWDGINIAFQVFIILHSISEHAYR